MQKKVTPHKRFLGEMEAVVPLSRLLALSDPHYPKARPKGGRPRMLLETMLGVYFLQNWYALSDPMGAFYRRLKVSDLLYMIDPVHASPKGSMNDHLEKVSASSLPYAARLDAIEKVQGMCTAPQAWTAESWNFPAVWSHPGPWTGSDENLRLFGGLGFRSKP